jgi:hypothetical protein
MPIHSLRKLLGHQHLNTAQIYAWIYDQTLYRQFREAPAKLEDLVNDEWPQTRTRIPVREEIEVAEAFGIYAFTKLLKITTQLYPADYIESTPFTLVAM